MNYTNCAHCRQPLQPRRMIKRYCSISCMLADVANGAVPWDHATSEKLRIDRERSLPLLRAAAPATVATTKTIICAKCGKSFAVTTKSLKPTMYCSRHCRVSASYYKTTKPCAFCGANIAGRKRQYCNNDCMKAARLLRKTTTQQRCCSISPAGCSPSHAVPTLS